MAGGIRVSEGALEAVGDFYKAYRVVPGSVHGKTLRVYCEDLSGRELERNMKSLSEIIGYNIVVNKRRLTSAEAERYFSPGSSLPVVKKEQREAFAGQVSNSPLAT